MPLFTSLLGFIILGEKISKSEILCLFIAFYGVYVLLYSGEQNDDKREVKSNISAGPLLMCIMGPFLMALTNVCLRYMKGLHEYTASTYSVLFSIAVYGICLPLSG